MVARLHDARSSVEVDHILVGGSVPKENPSEVMSVELTLLSAQHLHAYT
jgi:hypothetical protein